MVNICNNWVEIRGDEEQTKAFVELVGKEFDFNKIISLDYDHKDEAIVKWGCPSLAFDTKFEEQSDDEYGWFFWTKWSPAPKIYEALKNKFPDIFIYWRYEEPLMNLYGYLQNEDYGD